MKRSIFLAIAILLIAGVIIYLQSQKATHFSNVVGVNVTASSTQKSADYATNTQKYPTAKELVSPDGYINTNGQPITLSQFVGNKVVLVDFWTYSCINCQRTIPYLKAWYQKYKDQGLVIIGVHTPEFAFEKQLSNVQAAVQKFGITYPVVLDSEYQTWDAYHNNYWPEEYLIDIDGLVREHNIGEGNYQQTEQTIQELLAQRNKTLGLTQPIPTGYVNINESIQTASPETYFDWSRNEYLGNGKKQEPGVQMFTAPSNFSSNILYLDGTWNIKTEYAENQTANSKIIYHYNAKDVYFVASSQNGISVSILIDGKPISVDKGADVDANGQVLIKEPRLYKLVESQNQQEHVIEIIVPKAGLDAYTFTFG